MHMRKTIIDPDAGNELLTDSDVVSETAYSRGVAVEFDGYTRVFLSGVTPVETASDSIEAQTREVLETIQALLEQQGGEMTNVVRIRVFVQDVMEEEFETIHAVRGEFFEREHHPASALLEIGSIVRGNVEIEIEAVIPDTEWSVDHAPSPVS